MGTLFRALPSDWESYRIQKNQYNRLIKNTIKTLYYTDEISNNKGNIKNTWKSINKLINKQSKTSHVGHIKNENNEEVQDKDIQNAFNKQFIKVGQRLSRNIPITDKQPEAYINVSNARFHFQEGRRLLSLLSQIADLFHFYGREFAKVSAQEGCPWVGAGKKLFSLSCELWVGTNREL